MRFNLQLINMEENNFKNPFEEDEEDQLISLQPTQETLRSISNTPSTFTVQTGESKNSAGQSINLSEHSMFDTLADSKQQKDKPSELNQDDDPPLLEDIGINPQIIRKRMVAVMTLQPIDQQLVSSPDLLGPVLIALTLGILLLLGGKMHFSDIESAFVMGTILLFFFFNCMNKNVETVSLYLIMSFVGYSLLPMTLLAVAGVFVVLKNVGALLIGLCLAGWSSWVCGGMISVVLNREESRWLVIYPLYLFYLSFALIIIF